MKLRENGWCEETTTNIRWIKRGDNNTLQQMWLRTKFRDDGGIIGLIQEWRDVPIETEEDGGIRPI